ncbi:MAG: hypothetical protein HUU15_09505, partial [Candidatus Brocadiae bacterium]|nr:hypothetical protein [Candidatus Brocadiia bacterium]
PDPSRPAPREGPGVFIPLPLLLGGGAVLALGIVLVLVVGWKRSRVVTPPPAPPAPIVGDVVDSSGTPLPPARIPSTGSRTRLAALQEVDQGRVLLVAALKSWIASPDDGAKVRAAWLGWSDAIDRARGLPTAAPGSEEEVDRAYRLWLDAVSALRTAMRSVVEKAETGNPVAVVSRYDEVLAAQDVAVGAARTELDLLLPPGSR